MIGIIVIALVIFSFYVIVVAEITNPADKLYKKIEKSFDKSVREAAKKFAGIPPLQYEMVKLAIALTRGQWTNYYYHHIPQKELESLEKKGMGYFDMLDEISRKIGSKYVSQWQTFQRREREEQLYKDMDI